MHTTVRNFLIVMVLEDATNRTLGTVLHWKV